MKQIVLILLFIFAVQKKIILNTPENKPHKRGNIYELHGSNCEPGYEKKCSPRRGIYIRNQKAPMQCLCYEIKYLESLKKNLQKTLKQLKIKL